MTKEYVNLAISRDTHKKLKDIKEVLGITFDELMNELMDVTK